MRRRRNRRLEKEPEPTLAGELLRGFVLFVELGALTYGIAMLGYALKGAC